MGDYMRALVLGGGGVAGIGWEAGLIVGLRLAGVDLTVADLIVGTSAGSVTGTFVAQGADLAVEIDRIAQHADAGEMEPPVTDMDVVMRAFGILYDPALDPQEARRRVGALALETSVAGAGERLKEIGDRLPEGHWPDRRLLITAVDTEDGAFTVWDRDSGAPLRLAVASSCAVPCVFPPVEIGGRRYMDGGVRSPSNADLAKGAAKVVVIEPMAHFSPRKTLERELAELGDAQVATVGPDQAAIEAFGVNVLDPALWRPTFKAGLAQAAAIAERVGSVW
ncbi:MAG TPA: patatin-like phospholipase family protein [Streptosporangiaceae bacterium]|nr:patatin-like phospholipase family protein [Streptosporangiaceae bacterium]